MWDDCPVGFTGTGNTTCTRMLFYYLSSPYFFSPLSPLLLFSLAPLPLLTKSLSALCGNQQCEPNHNENCASCPLDCPSPCGTSFSSSLRCPLSYFLSPTMSLLASPLSHQSLPPYHIKQVYAEMHNVTPHWGRRFLPAHATTQNNTVCSSLLFSSSFLFLSPFSFFSN